MEEGVLVISCHGGRGGAVIGRGAVFERVGSNR